jgi:hypothetical protein
MPEGVSFTSIIAKIHATSMKWLSKIETPGDPAQGAAEDDSAVQKDPEVISPPKRQK